MSAPAFSTPTLDLPLVTDTDCTDPRYIARAYIAVDEVLCERLNELMRSGNAGPGVPARVPVAFGDAVVLAAGESQFSDIESIELAITPAGGVFAVAIGVDHDGSSHRRLFSPTTVDISGPFDVTGRLDVAV